MNKCKFILQFFEQTRILGKINIKLLDFQYNINAKRNHINFNHNRLYVTKL